MIEANVRAVLLQALQPSPARVPHDLVSRTLEGALQAFTEAGLRRLGMAAYARSEVGFSVRLRRSAQLLDPWSGHVLQLQAMLTAATSVDEPGRGQLELALWTNVPNPARGGLVSHRLQAKQLTACPGVAPGEDAQALTLALTRSWQALLDGPDACDFQALGREVALEFSHTLNP